MLIEKTYYARGQTEKDEIVKSLEKEYGIPQYMDLPEYSPGRCLWAHHNSRAAPRPCR